MPLAKIYVPADTVTPVQRLAIVKGIHDVINDVEQRATTAPTYVLITEIPAGSWGFAGKIYQPPT